MITGPRSMFVARCQQRGYTLEQVRGCIVSEDGDRITVDETHQDYPRAKTVEAPSFLEKLANFTKSAVNHVASGMPMCSQEQIDQRFAICRGCEFFQGEACVKCGCPLVREKKFVSKLSWANESCPVGKWGPVGQ